MNLATMFLLSAATAFAAASPPLAPPDLVFEEKNGVVAVEAEHFIKQEKNELRSWHITSTKSAPGLKPDPDPNHAMTASGGAYLEILPDTRRTHDDKLITGENFSNKPGQMAILSYKVHFNTPGKYYVWVRTYSTGTEDNGIHVGLNGTWPESGARMQWTAKRQWRWDSKQRTAEQHGGVEGLIWLQIDKPGEHTIQFSMREDGFEFDKFLLTTTAPPKSRPEGTGPAPAVKSGKMPAAFPVKEEAAAAPSRYPAHWGQPPAIQTRDLVPLPGGYGHGSSTLKHWIQQNLDKDAANKKNAGAPSKYPPHWGQPPLRQTRDLRPLPGGYGKGSSTLAKWIQQNLDQDAAKKDGDGNIAVTGELKQWHKVTLTLDGPYAHEKDNKPNPFTDYALDITFTHESGKPSYTVPGYFAADGNAAESSAESGTKWRAHLSPDKAGKWNYKVSFLTAPNILTGETDAVGPIQPLHDKTGSFTIAPTDKSGRDFRAHGRLHYVGKNHLRFAGSKQYFLKAGADAPETLLGYADFDGTRANNPKKVPLKHYKPHLKDWNSGDPTWKKGKGKGLIGALNYLSSTGANSYSFLPYNAGGDGDNIWPFLDRDDPLHYDCSKLDQWGIVFDHGTKLGLFAHFKLQETENDDLNRGGHNEDRFRDVPCALDGGDLGPERKLYCREIIARYGHLLALNWNLGEENTQTTKQQMDMANWIAAIDPYDHHLVIHTYPNKQDQVYKPLLGKDSPFTGASLQNSNVKDCHWQIVKWVKASNDAGKPWGVAFDEPGNAQEGMPPDPGYPGMPSKEDGYPGPSIHDIRKYVLWGTFLGGGVGVEYYFGYKLPQNDLVCEDWRSRDQSWKYCKIALDFFRDQKIPVADMNNHDELVGNPEHDNSAYCYAKKGLYLVYLPDGGSRTLRTLPGDSVDTIQWFNPRSGELGEPMPFKDGEVTAPDKQDHLAVLRRR